MSNDSLFSFDTENPVSDARTGPVADAAERAIKASKDRSKAAKGGQGTPREDTRGTGNFLANASPELRAEFARHVEELYNPKSWGTLLSLPCNVALTITGREHWNISADEKEELGASGSLMARFLMLENPKTLAALMLGSALFAIYVPRVAKELEYHAKKKKEEKKP